jgi:hypothetical protein
MPLGDLVPGAPEVLVLALEKGGDQVVLGAEVAIEAGLGDAGRRDHQVDPDRAHAFPIEQARGRLENALATRRVARSRPVVGGRRASGILLHHDTSDRRP